MRLILVTERTRPGSDEISRRETVLEGDQIRIGRGSPMEINLSEIDVDYHHANVVADGSGLKLVAVGENGLLAGKARVHDVALSVGTNVAIGRYQFSAEPGRDGADHVLIMKALPAAVARTRPAKRNLVDVLPSRRALAWLLAISILGVFVLWPMSSVLTRTVPPKDQIVISDREKGEVRSPHTIEALWTTGPLSKVHAEIGGECGSCHLRPFEKTTNAACLSCHATTSNHVIPDDHPGAALDNASCSDCHKEHNGGERPVVSASTMCADCHSNLVAIAPQTTLKPLSTFTADHPNFEPSIITAVTRGEDGRLQPTFLPRPFPKDAILQELSGLRFPHDKHMAKDGVALLTGKQPLACNDCHQVEAGGDLMRPIKMERDCGGCHQMAFAPAGTAIALPHADEAGIARIVEDYFLARLQDGAVAVEPTKSDRRRRLGGQKQKVAGNALTEGWAKEETGRQLDAIFGKTLCATCHEAQKVGDAETASGWLVQPALLQRNWMPRAQFSHKRHEEMKCDGCHEARVSKTATDVLMPQISGCRDCHKIEDSQTDDLMVFLSSARAQTATDDAGPAPGGTAGKAAPASCVTCHGFHLEDRPPVSPAHAELYQSQRTDQ